jgi:hypothetical protein
MKHRWLLSALVVACLVGCGGSPPPKSPTEDPGLPPPEGTEPQAVEPQAAEPEVGGSERAAPEVSPAPAPEPAAATSCKKLKKATCKVTRGCAWRDAPNAGCIEPDSEF